MTAAGFFIYLFGALAIVGALGMLLHRNPIFASLSLAVTFLSLAAIYAALDAHFLSIIQIIVYTGLIQVLIIYTIMLIDIGEDDIKRRFNPARIIGAAVAVIFAVQIIGVSLKGAFPKAGPAPEGYGTTAAVADMLYGKYVLPFEVVSVLLLSAIVSAVLLARQRRRQAPKVRLSEHPTPLDTESSVHPKLIKR